MITRVSPAVSNFNGYQLIQEARDHVPALDLLGLLSYYDGDLYFDVEDTPENGTTIDDVLGAHVADMNFDYGPLRAEEFIRRTQGP